MRQVAGIELREWYSIKFKWKCSSSVGIYWSIIVTDFIMHILKNIFLSFIAGELHTDTVQEVCITNINVQSLYRQSYS